jgi:hypothetical protein
MSMRITTLAKPGAGLPPIEAFFARYLIFPLNTLLMSHQQAIKQLVLQGQESLRLAQALSEDTLRQPILINRFPGIEDSSRHWSVLMTLHHLMITSDSMASIIEHLTQGKPYHTDVLIGAVKPDQAIASSEVFPAYHKFLDSYADRINTIRQLDWTTIKHAHPWFGDLNAHQWLCLNAMHHRIHLSQIKRIIKQL